MSAEQGGLDRQVVEPVHLPAGIHTFKEKKIVIELHDRSIEDLRAAVQ